VSVHVTTVCLFSDIYLVDLFAYVSTHDLLLLVTPALLHTVKVVFL
jgi:hypothetical protein